MELDPIAVALKFGFLAVLYLFLLWVARSALKDLRGVDESVYMGQSADFEEATGMYTASAPLGREGGAPKLRVKSGAGLAPGSAYDLSEGALLGRGDQADIRLEDGFASSKHARLIPQGDVMVLEDLGSTNGTYLNGEPLRGPQPLHAGDRLRIGVGRPELLDTLAGALARLGTRRAFLVHGRDGLDEVSLSGPTLVREVHGSQVTSLEWTPGDFGLDVCAPAELRV